MTRLCLRKLRPSCGVAAPVRTALCDAAHARPLLSREEDPVAARKCRRFVTPAPAGGAPGVLLPRAAC
ncbi:hypothetical protein WOLCODRAFT_26713, partial [Wolfiporia cocos MD-104 SS10]